MPAKIKIEFCTSCGSQDIKVTGNNYYCSDCDVTFKVTKAGTKVVDSNPLGKETSRINALEEDVAGLKSEKKPGSEPAATTGPAQPAQPAAGAEDEDEEQDGFITFEG